MTFEGSLFVQGKLPKHGVQAAWVVLLLGASGGLGVTVWLCRGWVGGRVLLVSGTS